MIQLPTLDKNYLTTKGDVLDNICWMFYGAVDGVLNQVLARNPILNEYPSVLPQGLILILPVLSFEANRQQLWDYVQPTDAVFTVTQQASDQQALKDALTAYQNQTDGTIFVSTNINKLYSPTSTVVPVLVGSQVPTTFQTPPLPSLPSTNSEAYVGVYYKGPDNTFRVGYITKDQLLSGTEITDVLVSGLP